LNFFVASSAPRLLTAKVKDFALPSRDAVIAHCSLGLRSGRLRGALFHNARSLRCAQSFLRDSNLVTEVPTNPPDAAAPRETVPAAPIILKHRLRVCLAESDHLRRPRCALGRPDPALPLGKPNAALRVRRSSLDSAHRKSIYGTRVNLISIVQLAARRKGIARSAALHLDCAPSVGKTGTYRFTLSIFQ
jgi:hypothetical protein